MLSILRAFNHRGASFVRMVVLWSLVGVVAVGCSCGEEGARDTGPLPDVVIDGVSVDLPALELGESFQSAEFDDCTYASPVLARTGEAEIVLAIGHRGTVRGLDPADLTTRWEFVITPDDDENVVELLSTPGIIENGHAAVVAWQEVDLNAGRRVHHRVAVLDLDAGTFHSDYAAFDVEGTYPAYDGSDVVFRSGFQLQRSEIKVVETPDTERGIAYLAMGNGPSVQPFHGWIFEIDLDAWAGGDEPVSANFVTTAENDCGFDGNRMADVCGGGIWNAAGVQIIEDGAGGYDVLAATGNGRIDLDREAYSYSIVRLRRGLEFNRGCDEDLCSDFDESDPSIPCLESCTDLFVARPESGEVLQPEDGTCDGLTFVDCLHALDGDLGANMPVVVQPEGGPRVMVQPGKDGGLYLIDYQEMGRMYQRLQVMDFCGTPDDACMAFWVGTFVTQPAVAHIDGVPYVILGGTMVDRTHPSGVTAVRVVMHEGEPRMEIAWQVPDFSTEDAVLNFRHHTGRPIIYEVDGEPFVFIKEVRRSPAGDSGAPPGVLWGIRVRDGWANIRTDIISAGQRFTLPLIHDDNIYVSTCDVAQARQGQIQAFPIRRRD